MEWVDLVLRSQTSSLVRTLASTGVKLSGRKAGAEFRVDHIHGQKLVSHNLLS